MITEFSPPYCVKKTHAGFIVINSKGGHEALFGNRGEAAELCKMMNENAEISSARATAMQAQLARGPVVTTPFEPPDDEFFFSKEP